jgi:hypothetical protein
MEATEHPQTERKKSTKARGRHNQVTKLFWILMYDDIVDYDDFSERVGSENDILDLIYDEIWKKTYCPKCKRFNTHSRSKYALKNILCHHCSTQWSALQETIFFKTRIDLVKWCYVIYAISFYPRKVSVKWLMTELKINSYNTVWHMANKVKAVANHSPKDKCIFRELENIFRRHRFI